MGYGMGREFRREGKYIYPWLIHVDVWQRPTQYCKAIVCVCAKSLQSYSTLYDSMDCSPPGSSVHGTLQARILEWAAMPSSRGSSQPRD